MSAYRSWRPIYQAMCPEPGPHDLFLVILINGVRVAIESVDDHERWAHAAQRLATEQECHVKVLPMTGSEIMHFCGIAPEPGPLRPIEELRETDPEFYNQAIQNCKDALLNCHELRDKQMALDLLTQMGVLLQ